MDIQYIQTVVHLIANSNVAEVEISSANGNIRVMNRANNSDKTSDLETHLIASTELKIPQTSSPSNIEPPKTAIADNVVTSKHIGRLKLAADTANPPCVKLGDNVNIGDTVAYVTSLARMLPVVSEQTGVVAEILLEEDSKVEYGTPILRLQ